MKYLIVGGNTGGAGAAARLRRLDEHAKIVMFEKGGFVSFSNCSLPYRLSEVVDSTDKLVLNTPQSLQAAYNIETRIYSEVIAIDRAGKKISVKDLKSGEVYEESYDKLVLAPGANAIVPPIEGVKNAPVFTVKTVDDIARLYARLKDGKPHGVCVIGGGFIGVEVAVNLREAGFRVSLVEAMPQILRTFDEDMVQILHKEMLDHGVELIVGESVAAFEMGNAVLASGRKIACDTVVMAIGVRPDTSLAVAAGLETNQRGAIKVDANYCTSDKDIYAVGDAIEVFHAITHKPLMLQLAGPAQKQARQAADHICGRAVRNTGYIGSSCIKVFGMNAASTGLTEAQCRQENISCGVAYVLPKDIVGIMPESCPLHYKLIYEVPTGKILGAQAISRGDAVKRVDVIAALIKFGGTVDDLRDLELCYAPPFATAKDVGNYAGLVASNLLQGAYRQVRVSDVRALAEQGACIIDVRPKSVYDAAHIRSAINIPMAQLRERINEIPKDRPVYIHCQIGQTSYNAVMALQGYGFTNVYNVSGGFLGLCYYEYFNDVTKHREPVVTKYIF